MLQGLVLQLLRALAPQVLELVMEQFKHEGTIPTPEELDAKILAKADAIISKGEDWLKKHPTT